MKEEKKCLFCQIINENKELLIYENDSVAAFLDIYPVTKAHILVVPKIHFDTWLQTDEKNISEVSISVWKIANQISKIYQNEIEGFNIVTNNGSAAGQVVFHYHVHIIPKFKNEESIKINHKINQEAIDNLNQIRNLLKEKIR